MFDYARPSKGARFSLKDIHTLEKKTLKKYTTVIYV